MRIRFGIIGAGQIAQLVSPVFRTDESLVATAVADVDRDRAGRLAEAVTKDLPVHIFEDYREMLRREDVDALYVSTPPFLHKEMVIEAIRAGKHVLCEKPFVLSLDQVKEIMEEAAAKPGVRVGCCSCRFHESPTARRARAMIRAGELGSVYRLTFEAVSAAPPVGATLPEWRNDPARNGGGIAFDWGVYDLDWIGYLLGDIARPKRLFGTMGTYFPLTSDRVPPAPDVDGRFSAEILCEGGLTIHWERRAAEHGPPVHRVEVRGSKGGLTLTMTPFPGGDRLIHHAYVGKDELRSDALPPEPPEWQGTLVYPVRDFASAILEGREPATPPSRSYFVHSILDALYDSAKGGRSAEVASPPDVPAAGPFTLTS